MSPHMSRSARCGFRSSPTSRTQRPTRCSYSSMRAIASRCAACQSSARKFSAARRVMRPNSSLYARKCSAIAAAYSLGDHTLRPGSARGPAELLGLGAAGHRPRGVGPGGDDGLHRVEVAGTDECLMFGRAISGALLRELALLHLRVAHHPVVSVSARELEHGQIQCMPAGEGDELEAVAHGRQLLAPTLHARGIQLALPVERG